MATPLLALMDISVLLEVAVLLRYVAESARSIVGDFSDDIAVINRERVCCETISINNIMGCTNGGNDGISSSQCM